MNLNTLYFVNNECYMYYEKMEVTGIMIHSTGVNNKYLKRYVGPNDGKLGENINNNHWNVFNPDGRQVCVHAFIGILEGGLIATYQTLPWDIKGWHAGGAANNNYIAIEICEDGLDDESYFNLVYNEALELCSYLINKFNININNVIDHSEGFLKGIASNHGDVKHWFSKFNKTMDDFRFDLINKLQDKNNKNTISTSKELALHSNTRELYKVQIGAFKDYDNARRMLEKAKSLGFKNAFIKK